MNRNYLKVLMLQKQKEINTSLSILNDIKLKRYYLITLDLDHSKHLKVYGQTKVLIKPFEFIMNYLKVVVLACEKDIKTNSDYYHFKTQVLTKLRYGAIIDYEAWDTSKAPLLFNYEYLSDLFKEKVSENNW
jgi:hypothetical protein